MSDSEIEMFNIVALVFRTGVPRTDPGFVLAVVNPDKTATTLRYAGNCNWFIDPQGEILNPHYAKNGSCPMQ